MSFSLNQGDPFKKYQIPGQYLAQQWPIKLACISSDSRLIAVAGRHGLAHYNSLSGKWKMFDREEDEMSFFVRGGMQWYGKYLIAAVELGGKFMVSYIAKTEQWLTSDAAETLLSRQGSHSRCFSTR